MPHLPRISEATSLALHAMIFLAKEPDDVLSTRTMAGRLKASEAHLAKVMQRLTKSRLVRPVRGPRGGFQLAGTAGGVRLMDIYRAMEGDLSCTACLFGEPACGESTCLFGGLMGNIHQRVHAYLTETTLSDVVERKRNNKEG